MKPRLNNLKSVACAVGGVLIMLVGNVYAHKASAPAAFSFDVYGDSRSMMYLPYQKDQEAEAHELMVDMFSLVLPEKVSQEMVNKYVKPTTPPITS